MADLGAGDFGHDDGSVPAEVAAVLAHRASGQAGMRDVVTVLARHRLLVPLLEVDADQLEGDDADPCAGQDRAVAAVSLRTDAGAVGLAFTGMDPLRAWRSEARPMPVPATRVAEALLAEGAVALVLDPSAGAPVRLTSLALARLAGGGTWPEPWDDPVVRQAVVAELGPVLASGEVQVRLAPPDAPEAGPAAGPDAGPDAGRGPDRAVARQPVGLVVEVRFASDLAADVAGSRAAVIAERLAASELLREAFDGILAVRAV
jgi:hypothetical protein